MSAPLLTRFGTLAGLSVVLACSSDPAATPGSSAGGSSGVSGSSAGAPVAGTNGTAMGGSTSQAGTGGSASPSGGTAGSSVAGGGAGGLSGGAGGAGGTGGGSAGTGGSAAGAGGADPEGWVNIFNGTDLTGWVPLIHKHAYNEDPYHTFRADPANHVIKITYADYPSNNFDDQCGLLYYNKPLTNYRVRATYRFTDPTVEQQAKNPVSWGKNNSGLMIFGIDPMKVTGDPEFPPLIEIQLLGSPSSGGSTSPNICTPGGMTYNKSADCGNNGTGKITAATTWVTVEADVHPGGDTKVYAYPPGQPDRTKPIETVNGVKYAGMAVTNGYLSIQSESTPCEFKDIQLIELP